MCDVLLLFSLGDLLFTTFFPHLYTHTHLHSHTNDLITETFCIYFYSDVNFFCLVLVLGSVCLTPLCFFLPISDYNRHPYTPVTRTFPEASWRATTVQRPPRPRWRWTVPTTTTTTKLPTEHQVAAAAAEARRRRRRRFGKRSCSTVLPMSPRR